MKKYILLSILTLLLPAYSYAQHWGYHGSHPYFRYHDHPHFGYHIHHFYANEYFPIWVGGGQYYYDDGIYYNYVGGDYVVAQPPMGAVVGTIPSDFQPVVVNGVTYYANNGTYYVATNNGYKVVAPPSQVQPADSGTYVINVPSNRGGYVNITIKRSGNGFVGPQGEFYSTFPQVSQLKLMYGR